MTRLKARAVELIQNMSDDNMLYVINILENLEAMSNNRKKDKKYSMAAFQDLMKIEKRLPAGFDVGKELERAREKKYGRTV